MKALIFSDSHGNISVMKKVITSSPDADCVIFAGDGVSDAEGLQNEFPEKMFFSVRGNNDYRLSPYGYEREGELLFVLEGKKIFLTHGHSFGVKSSLNSLFLKAQRDEIDLVIFGHTHIPYEEYNKEKRPFYFFNHEQIFVYSMVSDSGTPLV